SFDDKNQYRNKAAGPIQAHTHLILDSKSGRLLQKSGAKRYYMPHGLSLDRDDNVFKVKPGHEEPSLTLGRAFTPGNDKDKFCKPTDVAVSKINGDVFIADGYCNSRILRFSANGVYLSEFGKPTNGYYPAPPGTFQVPHSLTLIDDLNLLCVADRENERIQCFSAGLLPNNRNLPFGTFVRKAEKLGRVFAVDNINHFLIGVTNDGLTNSKRQLFTVDMETGDSDITEPGLMNPHDVAAAQDGTIFVAEIGPNRILRLHI
uniref:peptidylamidoglycolate lyase n=1 Tax=Romanomermis culicivorax TaxID=13658 RepID=A0A915J1W9_ROMCU